MPERPPNVPADAVKVVETKGTGPWQWCELKSYDQVQCRIYN
jgi:hypothetical protein